MAANVIDSFVFDFLSAGAEKVKKDLEEILALEAKLGAKREREHEKDKTRPNERANEEEKAFAKTETAAKKAAAAQIKASKEAEAAADKTRAKRKAASAEFFSSLQSIDGLLTRVAQTAAVGLTAAFGGAAAAIRSVAAEGDKIKTLASFTALSTTRFQELAHAAESSGLGADKLADGFKEFANNLRESAVSGGKGSAADSLRQLGLNFKEIQSLAPDAQLLKIADAAKELGPSLGRTAALSRLFGEEAGSKIGRLLDEGSGGIERMAREAHTLGAVMDDSLIAQAVAAENQWGNFLKSIRGVRNELVAQLLPAVMEYGKEATAWVAANRKVIGTKLAEFLKDVVAAGKPFVPWLKNVVSWAGDALKILKEWGPTLAATALAIKGVLVAKEVTTAVQGLAGAFTAAQGAAAGLAGATGIGAIAAALVIAIPLALKLGDALGDIGKQDTGPRATLAQKILRSQFVRPGGGRQEIAGGGAFASEIAKLSPADRAKLEGEIRTSARGKDIRNSAVFERLFATADDARDRSGATDAENKKLLSEAVAQGLQSYSKKELKSLLASGFISQEQFDLEQGRRKSGRFFTPRPEDGKEPATDAELAKLIASAARSGADVTDVLRGRKIAGGVPPVITVSVVNVKVDAPVTVNAKDGQNPSQIAVETSNQFELNLGRQVAKAIPDWRPVR